MKKNRNLSRVLAILLLFTMLLTLISGCGSNNIMEDGTGTGGHITENINRNDGNSQQQPAEAIAMGRYVEEVTDLSDRISEYGNTIYRLEDGSQLISDIHGTFLISKDNGVTWESDSREWLTRMLNQGNYIVNLAVGADNTAAVIYVEKAAEEPAEEPDTLSDEETEETEEEKKSNSNYRLLIIRPDGTEMPVDITDEEDTRLFRTYISDSGRIFVSMLRNDNLYEIKEDGSSELFLTIEEGSPDLIQFQGNLMIMDGSGYKAPLIYDMEKKEYIEDETLQDFVSGNYQDRNQNSSSNSNLYDLYFFTGEEGVLYLAGETGLYRHVIGGSVMEQVIDGNLCTFNNPSYDIAGMIMLENNEFLTLFSGGRLVRFVYNPDISTVPEVKLKVYSLKENDTLRQAVSLYQLLNPNVFVEYEIGMEEGGSVTREDALKSLNTEIMADAGPDVLIMDDIPINSYIEKGLLSDLSPILDSLGEEEALFSNLVEAMKTGDKIYAMPIEIQIPFIMGEEKYISHMADLESIADVTEIMREDNPEKDLLYICTEKGIMRFFSMLSVPEWTTENGGLDRGAVRDFLLQTKRIYDAQMDGLPEKIIEQYNSVNEDWLREIGVTKDDSIYLRNGSSVMNYIGGVTELSYGVLKNCDNYAQLLSANRISGFEDSRWRLLNGQSSNVFCAKTLIGINAASKYTEQAEDFVKVCLGRENQTNLYNGFAVNKAAFEDSFVIDDKDEDGAYDWLFVGNADGLSVELVVYCPSEEQITELRNYITSVDTPYVEDIMLEEAVYEEGIAYMLGMQSLDDAVDAIEKKVSIYLAE